MSRAFLLLSLVFLTTLAACGTNQGQMTKTDNSVPQESSPSQQSEAKIDGESEKVAEQDPYIDTFTDCLFYSAFGAIGDGKTNDIAAIVSTHKQANIEHRCVKADVGATYYIAQITESVPVQTSTDWRGASFIIDDSRISLDDRYAHVFAVTTTIAPYWLVLNGQQILYPLPFTSLTRHQKNIGLTLPYEAVLVLIDSTTLRYIRDGNNSDDGAEQTDIIWINKEGEVSEQSPIIWDYNRITGIQVFPVDGESLYLVGGTFTTIANQAASATTYYNRGININRSNVVVDGLTHYVEGELVSHGAPYNGFLTMHYAANITVKNTIFTAHKTYTVVSPEVLQIGSYDLQPTGVINLTLENCRQTNDILLSTFWGVMGTNYCKNIVLKKCEFSRFDAHHGVVGITIIDSKLGHQGALLVGEGDFVMKNTAVYGKTFITLRDDYGSTWRGNFYIENSMWDPLGKGLNAMPLIYAIYTGKHDFGYECYMPENITINGLKVNNRSTVYLFEDITPDNIDENFSYTYPYHITKTVNISGFESTTNEPLQISKNPYMFRNVEVNISN